MKKLIYSVLVLLTALSLSITSCKKKEDPKPAVKKLSEAKKPSSVNKDVKNTPSKSSKTNGSTVTTYIQDGSGNKIQTNVSLQPADNANTIVVDEDAVWMPSAIYVNGTNISENLTEEQANDFAIALNFGADGTYIVYDVFNDDWSWGHWYVTPDIDYIGFDLGTEDETIFEFDVTNNDFTLGFYSGDDYIEISFSKL